MANNEMIFEEAMIFSDPLDQFIARRLAKIQLCGLRRMKRITQKEMSEVTGLSVQCISDIENEDNGNPTLKSMIKYLDCLGYEISFQKKTI
jgi:DNA-binding XRE family transcriptional regulator